MAATPDHLTPKKSWAWLWVIIGLLVMAMIAFARFNPINFHGKPLPDDADLKVRDAIVPVEQNGLAQLRKLSPDDANFINFAISKGVDEDIAHNIQDGVSTNDSLVDEFLAQAQPDIVKLDDILQLPNFAHNDDISSNDKFPESNIVIEYSRVLRLSAFRCQALGEYPAAVRDVERLRLLARRLIEGHAPLLDVMAAIVPDSMARQVAQKLLDDPALPPASAAALVQAFSQKISWTGGLQRSFNNEYLFFVKGLGDARQTISRRVGAVPAPFVQVILNVEASKQVAASFYRQSRQALNGPYAAIPWAAFSAMDDLIDRPDAITSWLKPNPAGRFFLSIIIPAIENTFGTIYTVAADDSLLQIACALRQYANDHHALPGKLAELVPDYLAVLPKDPFNDEPLHYEAARGLVYSVGTSLKDSGGSSDLNLAKGNPRYEDPSSDRKQPTIQIGFPNISPMRTPVATPAH